MAGTSLLALLDDIATILDDVAVMTKVATKKTAGVLGDDLALNAQQVTGVVSDRELPVVWAVAKGSLINKVILVPAALAISAFAPPLVTVLLMLGGAFLCFEGFEKVFHKLFHAKEEEAEDKELIEALHKPEVDMVEFEKEKIKGAVRTDFILSAEIIVIALGSFKVGTPLLNEFFALVAISLVMTVGVYGLVAVIVRLDNVGMSLLAKESAVAKGIGNGLLVFAPLLMKFLAFAGTVAMFLVGGHILAHNTPPIHHFTEELVKQGGAIASIAPTLIDATTGVVAGGILVAILTVINKLRGKEAAH
jgi:predicted DNA repair protein MutK